MNNRFPISYSTPLRNKTNSELVTASCFCVSFVKLITYFGISSARRVIVISTFGPSGWTTGTASGSGSLKRNCRGTSLTHIQISSRCSLTVTNLKRTEVILCLLRWYESFLLVCGCMKIFADLEGTRCKQKSAHFMLRSFWTFPFLTVVILPLSHRIKRKVIACDTRIIIMDTLCIYFSKNEW